MQVTLFTLIGQGLTFAVFIFVTMNDDAPSLRDHLGPMWDERAAYQCDDWERTSAATVNMSCNWKVPQDNSCESYHLPTVHPQGRWWIEDDLPQATTQHIPRSGHLLLEEQPAVVNATVRLFLAGEPITAPEPAETVSTTPDV